MLGTVGVVVAQSLPAHGAINPWWVLLWLVLMAVCLLFVAGVLALVEFAAEACRKRFQHRPLTPRGSET